MARSSSPASTDSMASHITVDMDGSSEARSSIEVLATPMTSLGEADSTITITPNTASRSKKIPSNSTGAQVDGEAAQDDSSRRRSGRARHSLPTYNLNILSGTAKNMPRPGSRNVSGDTLVEDSSMGVRASGSLKENKSFASLNLQPLLSDGIRALDLNWRVDALPGDLTRSGSSNSSNARRSSRLGVLAERVEEATAAASSRIKGAASALGKRGREAFKSATGIEEKDGGPARKRSKLDVVESASTPTETEPVQLDAPKPRKKYLSAGLYVGMNHGFDARYTEDKNRKLQQKKGASVDLDDDTKAMQNNKTLPLPMFAGERLLDIGRPFKLPWEVFSPLPKACKPEEWKKTSRNYFIDDAASLWKKTAQLPMSHCTCPIPAEDSLERGCGDNCHNRHMMYECDDTNCRLGEACSNRSYSDLKQRIKKGNLYDIGVEVTKTEKRGYGVRSMRGFDPGQIIMEYTGEIVTLEEMERRMNVDYKGNDCYYMMEFHNGMYIDATRGSIARFVNHSCEPNCEMVKWVVAGQPRMALFAGEKGIVTGDELTYDYNFQNFAKTHQQACYCGAPSCRGVLGPRTKEAAPKRESTSAGVKRKLTAAMGKTKDNQKFDVATTSTKVAAASLKRKTASKGDESDTYETPPAKRHKSTSKAKSLLARASSLKVGKSKAANSVSSGTTKTKSKSTSNGKTTRTSTSIAVISKTKSTSKPTTTTTQTTTARSTTRIASTSTTASSSSTTALLSNRSTSTSSSRRTNITTPSIPAAEQQISSSKETGTNKKKQSLLPPATTSLDKGKRNLQQMRETMRRFLQPENSSSSSSTPAAVGSAVVTEDTVSAPRKSTSSARNAAVGVVRTIKGKREAAKATVGKKSLRVVAAE